MTSLPAGRPLPDATDLRLLVELARSGSIGLPQAAWQAGMSQPEAAARMVAMAEAGMPLRLVVEGEQQTLWQIIQRAGLSDRRHPAPLPTKRKGQGRSVGLWAALQRRNRRGGCPERQPGPIGNRRRCRRPARRRPTPQRSPNPRRPPALR